MPTPCASVASVEDGLLQLDLAGLDLGEVEHVVEDGQQELGRTAIITSSISRCWSLRSVSASSCGHAQHAVQRRADLVAHGGEEGALGAVGALGRLLLLLQGLGQGAGLGEQARAHLGGEQHVEGAVGRREVGELQGDERIAVVEVGNVAEHQPGVVAPGHGDAAQPQRAVAGEAQDHRLAARPQARHVPDRGRPLDPEAVEERRADEVAAGVGEQGRPGGGDPAVRVEPQIGREELGEFARRQRQLGVRAISVHGAQAAARRRASVKSAPPSVST